MRITSSNCKAVGTLRSDLSVLKTKNMEIPVEETQALMQLNYQNQSRFHNANGYMNLRQLNQQTVTSMKIEERMLDSCPKDKARAEGAHLLRRYHGKKIFVYHSHGNSQ